MHRFIALVVTGLLLSACSKTGDNIIWEKTFGQGEARFVTPAGDTAIICGGTVEGKPYIAYLDKNHNRRFEYNPDVTGAFTSAIAGSENIIAAGSSAGKLNISFIQYDGIVLIDTLIDCPFDAEGVSLCKTGTESFLAVVSRSADSITAGTHGLSFISFDNTGTITRRKDTVIYSFYSASSAATDNQGNIYLAVTRPGNGGKMKASVARFDEWFSKVWERELYNNPDFGASSLALTTDNNGNVYVSGYAELPVSNGTNLNSFAASVSPTGTIRWKNYLEYTNHATSLFFDNSGSLLVLNGGCLILNLLTPADGTVEGIMRTYASCDPKLDKAEGNSAAVGYGNSLVIAGSKNGLFYLAARPPDVLSPI